MATRLPHGGLYMVGGQRLASSPAFAGLRAILDHHTGGRHGNLRIPILCTTAIATSFHDVTTGTTYAAAVRRGFHRAAHGGTVDNWTHERFNAGAVTTLLPVLGSVEILRDGLNWGSRSAVARHDASA